MHGVCREEFGVATTVIKPARCAADGSRRGEYRSQMSEDYYNLINQTSGMALDNANSGSNGTSLIQWPPGGNNTNQGWEFVNVGGFYPYQLINQADGKAMDNGGSTTAGTTVNQMTQGATTDADQNWQVVPIAPPSPSNGFYQLVCVTSGMVLDNEGSTTAGTPCHQWASQTNNPNQVWQLNSCGLDGNATYYNLVCQDSGMALDGNNATGNGTPVVQNPLTAGDANQEWVVILNSNYCTVTCVASGLALDNEGSTSEGNGIWQWTPQQGNTNQEWQFVINSTAPQSGSIYNLLCQESGMVLDNGGSTTSASAVVQNPLVYNDTDQEWKLTSTTNGYYTLACQDSGKSLDNGGTSNQGAAVEQVTSKSGDTDQEWSFVSQGNGYYSLICLNSGMALDNGNTTSAGSDVIQYGPNGGSTQSWQLNLVP